MELRTSISDFPPQLGEADFAGGRRAIKSEEDERLDCKDQLCSELLSTGCQEWRGGKGKGAAGLEGDVITSKVGEEKMRREKIEPSGRVLRNYGRSSSLPSQ